MSRPTPILLILLLTYLGAPFADPDPRPNIVLILTDDEDVMLGGEAPITQTKQWFREEGATLLNYFVTTPVCCPSRTTLLSGQFDHNLNDETLGWCGDYVDSGKTNETFAVSLRNSGYNTGLFGKYVNGDCGGYAYNGGAGYYVPEGWSEWFAMCNDNTYFDMHWNDNGVLNKTGDYFDEDGVARPERYSTSIIGNRSIAFLERALAEQEGGDPAPFFMYIAPHACHVPATPAPWYQDALPNVTAVVTPNYDVAPEGHHWLVSTKTTPLNDGLKDYSDMLARMRQLTLLSVDDIVSAIREALTAHDSLDNTFVIYTSDHGYNLGQFRLTSGKYNAYEHDIRAPFFVRGPGVVARSLVTQIGANVDLSQTILDLAGLLPTNTTSPRAQEQESAEAQDQATVGLASDGRSLLPLFVSGGAMVDGWRDRILLEYWGCCDASGTSFVWRGNCQCFDPYPNLCGVHDCGGNGVNDTLLDAPGNTWLAIRVINATHNLILTEYRGRTDPPVAEFSNFTSLFDLNNDPYQLENLVVSSGASGQGVSAQRKLEAADGAALNVDVDALRLQLYALAECSGSDCFV